MGRVKAGSQAAQFGAAAFFGFPAVLFLVAGTRLLFQRPNAYRSLLRPSIWYALCIAFALLTVVGGAFLLKIPSTKLLDAAIGMTGSALLALLCYGAGRQAARNGSVS